MEKGKSAGRATLAGKRRFFARPSFIGTFAAGVALLTTFVWLASSPECLFGPGHVLSAISSRTKTAGSSTGAAATPGQAVEPVGPKPLLMGKIPRGATASGLLGAWLNPAQVHDLATTCKPVFSLTRLRAGNPYTVFGDDSGLERFEYEIDSDSRLVAVRGENGFSARIEPIVYDVRTATTEGVITANLFQAIDDAGEHAALGMMLYQVFAWEVDFLRGLRKGDSFKVLFEKRFREGKFAGYGKVLAAEFRNQGQEYRGYRFEHGDGRGEYYDEHGRNLKKSFLKAPLAFTRISSKFSKSRLHPILKIRRPHPGIDYAAPRGTPVKAVGDAVVTTVTRTRAAGRYVTLRHPNGYTSSYLHLNGYARGMRSGKKVRQGEVIGYVGSTGLATGPHLDFRMKYLGKWVNPAKMKNPRKQSLTPGQMVKFSKVVRRYTAALGLGTTVAQAGQIGQVGQ